MYGCSGGFMKRLFTTIAVLMVAVCTFAGDAAAFVDLGFSRDGKTYVFCLLQVVTEVSSAVGGCQNPCQRGNGGNVESAGTWCTSAGQRAGSDNHQVIRCQWGRDFFQMVTDNFSGHSFTANEQAAFFIAPRVIADLSGG